MRVTIRLFARLRDLAGSGELVRDVPGSGNRPNGMEGSGRGNARPRRVRADDVGGRERGLFANVGVGQ